MNEPTHAFAIELSEVFEGPLLSAFSLLIINLCLKNLLHQG